MYNLYIYYYKSFSNTRTTNLNTNKIVCTNYYDTIYVSLQIKYDALKVYQKKNYNLYTLFVFCLNFDNYK